MIAMANEKLSLWNQQDENKNNSFFSQLKNFHRSLIVALSLTVPYNLIWQTTVDTTTVQANKSQAEGPTDEILSPEQILEKHNIADLEIATVAQLQAAFDEITILLKKSDVLVGEERKPYLVLRWELGRQIPVTNSRIEAEKAAEEAENAEKALELLKWGKE